MSAQAHSRNNRYDTISRTGNLAPCACMFVPAEDFCSAPFALSPS